MNSVNNTLAFISLLIVAGCGQDTQDQRDQDIVNKLSTGMSTSEYIAVQDRWFPTEGIETVGEICHRNEAGEQECSELRTTHSFRLEHTFTKSEITKLCEAGRCYPSNLHESLKFNQETGRTSRIGNRITIKMGGLKARRQIIALFSVDQTSLVGVLVIVPDTLDASIVLRAP